VWHVATNLVVAASGAGSASTVTSAPIALVGRDRLTFLWLVPIGFGASSWIAYYEVQGSNDGVEWVPLGFIDSVTATTASPRVLVATATTRFARVVMGFQFILGAGFGCAVHRLTARLDHS
jgi:hypothetical protein